MRSVPVKLFLGHLSLRGPVHDAVSTSVFHTLCASGMFFPRVDEGFHDGSPWSGLLDTESLAQWPLPQYGSWALRKWCVPWAGRLC